MKKILFVIIILLILFNFNVNSKNISTNKLDRDSINSKIINNMTDSNYKNDDIIGYLKIDNILNTPVVQGNDNSYYLKHNINKEVDKKGSVFLDYRNSISDKKLIIYGHSGKEKDLSFNILNKYSDFNFYKKHSSLLFIHDNKIDKYKIFSSYIEKEDYDYLNLKDFNGSYIDHLNKLKNKSKYLINTNLDDNSKIIILQTCSMIDIGKRHFMLVIGVKE